MNLNSILTEWERDSKMAFAPHKSFSVGAGRRVLEEGEAAEVNGVPFVRVGAVGQPQSARYLGWSMGIFQKHTDSISWEETFTKASSRLAYLGKFKFGFEHRVRVLKALLLSLFSYKAYFLLPPKGGEKRFDSLITSFLWGSGRHCVSRKGLKPPPRLGGWGILGLGEMCEAFQASLVSRLFGGKLKSAFEDWTNKSMGLKDGRKWTDVDLQYVTRRSWVVNGLATAVAMAGGPSESEGRMTAEALRKYQVHGSTQFTGLDSKLRGISLDKLTDTEGERVTPCHTKMSCSAGFRIGWDDLHLVADQVPESWKELLSKGGEGVVQLRTNPLPERKSVREAKDWMGARHGDLVEAKWNEVAKGRSDVYLQDLGKTSKSLLWQQKAFNCRYYCGGDQLGKFIEGAGACRSCPSGNSTYLHIFFNCTSVRAAWKEWRKGCPAGWTRGPGDQYGFPQASAYDVLDLPARLRVLQWLVQGAEIRTAAWRTFKSRATEPVPLQGFHPLKYVLEVTAKLAKGKGKGGEALRQRWGRGGGEGGRNAGWGAQSTHNSIPPHSLNTTTPLPPPPPPPKSWNVLASDGKATYKITEGPNGLHCSCKGFHYKRICRHITEINATNNEANMTNNSVSVTKPPPPPSPDPPDPPDPTTTKERRVEAWEGRPLDSGASASVQRWLGGPPVRSALRGARGLTGSRVTFWAEAAGTRRGNHMEGGGFDLTDQPIREGHGMRIGPWLCRPDLGTCNCGTLAKGKGREGGMGCTHLDWCESSGLLSPFGRRQVGIRRNKDFRVGSLNFIHFGGELWGVQDATSGDEIREFILDGINLICNCDVGPDCRHVRGLIGGEAGLDRITPRAPLSKPPPPEAGVISETIVLSSDSEEGSERVNRPNRKVETRARPERVADVVSSDSEDETVQAYRARTQSERDKSIQDRINKGGEAWAKLEVEGDLLRYDGEGRWEITGTGWDCWCEPANRICGCKGFEGDSDQRECRHILYLQKLPPRGVAFIHSFIQIRQCFT
jgi:hypothetical protein